jgi:hypothetical protein
MECGGLPPLFFLLGFALQGNRLGSRKAGASSRPCKFSVVILG